MDSDSRSMGNAPVVTGMHGPTAGSRFQEGSRTVREHSTWLTSTWRDESAAGLRLADVERASVMPGGEKVPIVFFPRFTTVAGVNIEFWTQPMDMLDFETAR